MQLSMTNSFYLSPPVFPSTNPDDVVPAPYPPDDTGEVLPSLPSDPIPNPEPGTPSLGTPDPGIYEGTGGTASLE